MSKIYLVYSGVHYEGTDNIRAFTDKAAADALCSACEAHQQKRPTFPEGEYNEAADKKYTRATKKWEKEHPGGTGQWSADYFDVEELDLCTGGTEPQNK